MNKFIEKYVKNKTVGFWLGFGASLALLITDIIFIAVDFSDRTFSAVTFALILVGAAAEIAYFFLDFGFLDFIPLVACLCFGVALGMHLNLGLATLSDVWNGVNFIGGDPKAAIGFGIVFILGTIVTAISCFMRQRKA
ncbi:MAG: hypothetical protein OSJ83_06995 [Clostridia bacterium]|nr:hypothetical protein [Clostridia bacterium]